MVSNEVGRLFPILRTFQRQRGIRLFDDLAKDPANAAPILEGLLLVGSNHDDPHLHTPQGLLTLNAGRALLRFPRPPGGLAFLSFLVLYNSSLQNRTLTLAGIDAEAGAIPAATQEDMERAYRKVVHDHAGSKAAALQTRIGMDHGIEEAAHLAIRTSLDDLGRLGHNLATAVAYSDAATTLGLPRGLVPLANLGHVQAGSLQSVPPIGIPSLAGSGPGEPDVELLGRLLEDWEFERVEEILRA